MIRIIKNGNTVFRFRCWNCGCVYECDSQDYVTTTETRSTCYNDPIALHISSICPECGETNSQTKAPRREFEEDEKNEDLE